MDFLDTFAGAALDIPLILSFVFAAIAAGALAWALWIRRTMAREAELLELVRERTAQLEEANRRLEALSYRDALTGVANRRAFDQALDAEWRRGLRARRPLSVLLVDIDHFKRFNDTYGHPAGDRSLGQVAAALAGVIHRPGDTVARYGGEEFGVLLPETDPEGAAAVGDRMREAVEALRLAHAGGVGGLVTISAGVATVVPSEDGAPEALVAAADAALYDAKRGGRNRVCAAAVPAAGSLRG
ncbi:MAG TPA: diguanylate cyclase [Vicinamibacterales bacterium]|nr:diguanylate cyclase [Vicinamibacterales bacterium]